ncbi:MAG: PQQ-binding-like beta-propeller repeat protein [Paludibacter sp.]
MVKDGGILSCIDSESGKLLYKTRIGNACPHIALPIAASGLLYIFGFNGKLEIVKAGDTYELVGQNDFSNKIVATLAIIGNMIYIRTGKELLAYFEAGGKNKGLKQIQGIDKAFIVKDDIDLGYLNTILS